MIFSEWAISKHKDTNHFYDKYLPYEFHLRMVVNVFHDFKHLLPVDAVTLDSIEAACWGHDLIEDARCSYNDVREMSSGLVADIIYACTNHRGKNRAERANDDYYKLIRETPGAAFVKLCDRIANVQYSKLTKSRMFDMYKKENPQFVERIGNSYPDMVIYLNNLFSTV